MSRIGAQVLEDLDVGGFGAAVQIGCGLGSLVVDSSHLCTLWLFPEKVSQLSSVLGVSSLGLTARFC